MAHVWANSFLVVMQDACGRVISMTLLGHLVVNMCAGSPSLPPSPRSLPLEGEVVIIASHQLKSSGSAHGNDNIPQSLLLCAKLVG